MLNTTSQEICPKKKRIKETEDERWRAKAPTAAILSCIKLVIFLMQTKFLTKHFFFSLSLGRVSECMTICLTLVVIYSVSGSLVDGGNEKSGAMIDIADNVSFV